MIALISILDDIEKKERVFNTESGCSVTFLPCFGLGTPKQYLT